MKELNLTAEDWQKTFDSIADLVFIQDMDFVIIKANKAFLEALGARPEDIIGKKCYEILHNSDKPWPTCPFDMAKEDRKTHTEEVDDPHIGKPLLVTVSPIFDESGKLVGSVHIAKDITELKKAEFKKMSEEMEVNAWGLRKTRDAVKLLYKELEDKNRILKQLDQLKTDFISTVSHELRTPLAITKEGISLVLDGITGDVNEKQSKVLTTAKASIDRLARLINNLLDISKIEAGKVELKRELIDIGALLHQVASSFEQKVKDKGLELKVATPKGGMSLYADTDRITQVFTNLIYNAVKFTDEGFIEISAKSADDEIEFSVSDTGIGISREDLSRTFGKFQQFGRVHGAGDKGTGLGLSIAKGIVELHKGRIWVESEVGKGASFIFTLPKYTGEMLLEEFINDGIKEAIDKDSMLSLVIASPAVGKSSSGKKDVLLDGAQMALTERVKGEGNVLFRAFDRIIVPLQYYNSENAMRERDVLEKLLSEYMSGQKLGKGAKFRLDCMTYPDDVKDAGEMIDKVKNT